MTAMTWRVKSSLLRYLAGTADGRVEMLESGELSPHGLRFPAIEGGDPLAFRGVALITGHGGLLRIFLGDPRFAPVDDGWQLSVRVEDGGRVPIARVSGFARDDDGVLHAGETTLLSSGVELFGSQYAAGTVLDSPTVRD